MVKNKQTKTPKKQEETKKKISTKGEGPESISIVTDWQ